MAANEASAFDILIKITLITLRLWLLLQFRAWSCSQVWLHHACRVTDPRPQTDRAQGTHMQLPLTPTPPQTTVMSTTSCGHVALAPCPALSLADLLTLTLSLAPLSPGQRASSSPLHSRAAGQWRPRAHWLLPETEGVSEAQSGARAAIMQRCVYGIQSLTPMSRGFLVLAPRLQGQVCPDPNPDCSTRLLCPDAGLQFLPQGLFA